MFSTILEGMITVEVPDRNDPSKTVELNRYVIDKNEKPTAVIFGKFAPWTGKKGHGRLVDFAKQHFDDVVIVSPTRKKVDPKVDIFTDEQKKKIIEEATGARFIRVDSSIPIRMFTRVVQAGVDRPVFIVGPDRIKDFQRYFVEYDPKNEGTTDPSDSDFGKGEYFFLESRGEEDTSGTKVRRALLDKNKEEFLRLTGYEESVYDMMIDMLKKNNIIESHNTMRFDKFYYLKEGGNVKVITKDGKEVPAEKIPMDKISAKQFRELQKEIVDALRAFNKEFEKKYNKPLFPKFEENVKSGKLFSGSTRLFFSKPYDEFSKHKKAVGDMDLQYPEELRPLLKEFLKDNEGQKFGKMTFLGKGGKSQTQENTIFVSSVVPDLVKNIQIDFEPTFFEDGVPNEFSTFAHYSSWQDIKNKVKGAFSKLLMRSLVSAKQRLGDIAIQTPTGKISTSTKYDNPAMRKFSVDKGMRVAFEPVLDDKGEIQRTPEGKPIYKEIPTKVSNYERDIEDIFAFVFEKKPTPVEKKDFHSFVGILKLMKKYLDNDTIKMVYNNFMDIIWRKGQEIEQGPDAWKDGIQMNDFEAKKAAYDEFAKVFPQFKMSDEQLRDFVLPFYQDLKRKKGIKK